MSTVREVLPPPKITYLPNVPAHVAGVYNLRGNIISLVDIQQILGLKSNGKKDTDMVLLVESYNLLISFVVEKVLDFVEVENSKIQLPSKNIPAGIVNFVRGIFKADNIGQIYLLDAERLLNSNMVFAQEN
jgi:chemotaxis signal transduction protein